MSTFDLCSSCHKLIQPFAQLSNFPLDFPQLRLLSPTTQIIVAELLCDVCLELASQHADVRVTVDRPFAIFEPSSVDALDDEIEVDPVLSASCHVAQSRSLPVPFAVFRHVSPTGLRAEVACRRTQPTLTGRSSAAQHRDCRIMPDSGPRAVCGSFA